MVFGWLVGSVAEPIPADASDRDTSEPADNNPETPAPVFVARAFRSLIVGNTEPETPASKTAAVESRKIDERVIVPLSSGSPTKPLKSNLSPSKPSGILLTPGTANGKRKSVSFGGSVKEENARPSRSGLPNNYPGKFPSPWTPKVESIGQTTTATDEAFIEDVFTSVSTKTLPTTMASERTNAFKMQLGLSHSKDAPIPRESEADKTTAASVVYDTGSSTYWRNELEKHTQKAEAQRKKLENQKQMVKSYARKKDTEANDLSIQLRLERKKVLELDAQVSYLAAKLADLGISTEGKGLDAGSKTDLENIGQIPSLSQLPESTSKTSLHAEIDQLKSRLQRSDRQIASLKSENQLLNAELVRTQESLKRQEAHRNTRERRFDDIEAEFAEQKTQFKQRLETLKQSHTRQVESLQAEKTRLERNAKRDQFGSSCSGDCHEASLLQAKLERTAQKHEVTVMRLKEQIDGLKHQQSTASLNQRSNKTTEDLTRAREEAAQWRIEYAMLEATLLKKEREMERLKRQTQKADEPATLDRPGKSTKHASLFDIAESDAGLNMPSEMLPAGSEVGLESGIWEGLDLLDHSSAAQPRFDVVRPNSLQSDELLETSPIRLPHDEGFMERTNLVLSASKKEKARQRSTLPADRMAAAKARIAQRAAAKRLMHALPANENQENWSP